ncbi:MAG: NAD-dependent epimerase/dehydratase family protein [Ardenticatenaceae bacterium]|nr:NAD-dependent epimerase/dehydratase family protein [Ardenticatenaceae bacterium]HBY94595.1 hypothetical protein [Chloroflexota bacterium]
MKILVLGGTSFFGAEIAAQLVNEGHAVTLFTRGQRPLPPPLVGKVDQLLGDRTRRADLARAAAAGPWDALIDNIAFTPDDVALALDLFSGTGRYVLTSTGSVYRWAPADTLQPLDEEDVDFSRDPAGYGPGDPGWDYAHGKVYAEKVLREQSQMPWTIIRPPVVLGPHDPTHRGAWYFARLMRGGPLLLANSGANSFRLVFSEDLARAYRLALGTERAVGRTYNIAQPEIITLREFLEAAATILQVEPDFVEVPARFLDQNGQDLGGPYAGMTFIPSIARAETDLGFGATPFKTWLATTVRWYRDEFEGRPGSVLQLRDAELSFAERWRRATASFGD